MATAAALASAPTTTQTPDACDTPGAPTIIAAPGRPWTEADLLRLGADGRYRYELVRGELRQMSPASFQHGALEARLLIAIGIYLRAHPTAGTVVTGDTGFQLQADPVIIRAPDVAFVATARIPTTDPPAFLPLAPDLVVEIISPSERAREVTEKVGDYLHAGTRLLWLVYPQQQEVQEYRAGGQFYTYRRPATLDGRTVLPGFHYPLDDLFA